MSRILVLAPLFILSACQGVADDGADDTIVRWTRTIVQGRGDGSAPAVTEEWVDASTRQIDGVDSACATSDGRLWAGNNFTGAEICFSGVDDYVLNNYSYWICGRFDCWRVSWAKNVHSIKTGAIFGMIYEGPYPNFACQDIVEPHQQIAGQDACMKIAERYDQGLTGIP
jgi:hypothetical protein